jgi:hypothetical protein
MTMLTWLLHAPGTYLFLSVVVVALGVLLIVRFWARAEGSRRTSVWREYRPVVLCFALLLLFAGLIGRAAYLDRGPNEAFSHIVYQSVFASLLEDLIFFSVIGFIILVVQRREADRSRNIDDKIDLLFNAKKLGSDEISYLRDEVRKISADCQRQVTELDVIDHDPANSLILLDVSRRFQVGNYLRDEPAEYTFQLGITPDDACGNRPCLIVFPSISTSMVPNGAGGWARGADDQILDEGGEVEFPNRYRPDSKVVQIPARSLREFRTRLRGWQPLYKPTPQPPAGAFGPVKPELDHYNIVFAKHWDEVTVNVRNSLQRQLRVTIKAVDATTFDLQPGDHRFQALRVQNSSAKSRIAIVFEPR